MGIIIKPPPEAGFHLPDSQWETASDRNQNRSICIPWAKILILHLIPRKNPRANKKLLSRPDKKRTHKPFSATVCSLPPKPASTKLFSICIVVAIIDPPKHLGLPLRWDWTHRESSGSLDTDQSHEQLALPNPHRAISTLPCITELILCTSVEQEYLDTYDKTYCICMYFGIIKEEW